MSILDYRIVPGDRDCATRDGVEQMFKLIEETRASHAAAAGDKSQPRPSRVKIGEVYFDCIDSHCPR